jgi:translation initiation factor IF-3
MKVPHVNDDLAGIASVRLIDERGEVLGIVAVSQALTLARARGLDLVEVDADSEPPVCKIIDLAKFDHAAARTARRGPI